LGFCINLHVFGLLPEHDQFPLSHYWTYLRLSGETKERFDYSCFWQASAMQARKGPCWLDGQSAAPAWHFDASLVVAFLCRFATEQLGVNHI
jgi:tryptophan 6-halogenase